VHLLVLVEFVNQFRVHAMNSVKQAEIHTAVCPVMLTAFDMKSEDNRMAAAGSSQCGTDRQHCHGCADDCRQRHAVPLALPSSIATALIRSLVTTTSRHWTLQHDSVFSDFISIIKIYRQLHFSVHSAITSQFPLLKLSRNRPTWK
jgi:ribosomal protein S26